MIATHGAAVRFQAFTVPAGKKVIYTIGSRDDGSDPTERLRKLRALLEVPA